MKEGNTLNTGNTLINIVVAASIAVGVAGLVATYSAIKHSRSILPLVDRKYRFEAKYVVELNEAQFSDEINGEKALQDFLNAADSGKPPKWNSTLVVDHGAGATLIQKKPGTQTGNNSTPPHVISVVGTPAQGTPNTLHVTERVGLNSGVQLDELLGIFGEK